VLDHGEQWRRRVWFSLKISGDLLIRNLDLNKILRPSNILSRKFTPAAAASRRTRRAASQNPNGKEVCFNALPHPGLLPMEKENRSPRLWKNQRRDGSDGLSRMRKRAKVVPSPRGRRPG